MKSKILKKTAALALSGAMLFSGAYAGTPSDMTIDAASDKARVYFRLTFLVELVTYLLFSVKPESIRV